VSSPLYPARKLSRASLELQLELTRRLTFPDGEPASVTEALRETLRRICETTGWPLGQAWTLAEDSDTLECCAFWRSDPGLDEFVAASRSLAVARGAGLPGQAWAGDGPVWWSDLSANPTLRLEAARATGIVTGFAVPVLAGGAPVVVLEFFERGRLERDSELAELVLGVATGLGSFVRRKQAEERLRESEARFRAVVETAPDAVISADESGRITYFNDGAAWTFGYSADEVMGCPLTMLMPERFHAPHRAGIERYLRTREPRLIGLTVEVAGRKRDGSEFPAELSLGSWPMGDQTFFTGIIRDLSERHAAQRAVAKRESQLAEAEALAQLGSFEWNVADAHGMTWSAEVYRILGLDPERFSPSPASVRGLVHPDDLGPARRQIEAALAKIEPASALIRAIRPEGSVRTLAVRVTVVGGEAGSPERVIGTCQDITDQVRESRARQEAQQRFATAFENAPIGMALTATDGAFLQVNRALTEMLGYSESGLLERSSEEVTHPGDVALSRRTSEQALAGGPQSFQYEQRYLRPDGSVVYGRLSGSLVRDENGQPLHFIAQVEDITDRRRTDEALRQSREQFQGILDNSASGIYLKDMEGRYLVVNAGAAAFLGKEVEDMVGRTDAELLPSSVAERFTEHDRQVTQAGEPVVHEELVPTPTGERTVLSQKFLLRDVQGAPYALAGIATDITGRVQIEEENRRLQVALDQSQRVEMVGRLAGGIAHDFNNLLAVILNYAALLAEEVGEGSAREDVGEIRKAAERAASLTQQLLAFSRRQHFEAEILSLNTVVRGAQRLLSRAIEEDLAVELELAPNLWPVKADRGQLERVLLNLALNARDATSAGGSLTIRTANVILDAGQAARMAPHVAAGRHAALSVIDHGHGMEEDVKHRALEPFFTTKAPGEGTGLGLASVYGAIRQGEGHVELVSAPGEGTTVTLYLPARTDREPFPARPAGPPEPRTGGNEAILVVEDEASVRQLVQRILEESGYLVAVAGNPAEALEVHRRRDRAIDLLLTDLVMPGMSGSELAERLQTLQPGLSVVFMSGYGHEVLARHGLADEEVLMLSKPFTPDGLLRCVAKALQMRRPTSPRPA